MCAIEYYTYEDYVQWEGKWELIDGIPLAMAPSPIVTHQAIAALVVMELSQSALECEKCMVVGEMDWKINDETILRPDILLVCNERNEAYISKTPEIVVEVISPSTARRDEKFKFEIYENEKVLYYVMIYPSDCKAKIYKLKNGKFDKEGDFFKEAYTFEDASCGAKVDFENVFSRFCK